MIVVTIDLQSARTGQTSRLGRMVIANDGSSVDPKRGDYDVWLGRKTDAGSTMACVRKPLRTGHVSGHAKLAYSVWRLILRAILAAYPEWSRDAVARG